jgi:hypothetical protein
MRQEQDRKADTQGHWTKIATICGFLGRRMVKEENEGRDPKGNLVVGVAQSGDQHPI